MSEAAELKKLVKQLQNAPSTEDITSVLNVLKKEYKVNEAVLRESKAGLAVGKLRSHANKEVSDLAKELVKKWKTEVEKAKGQLGGATPTTTTISKATGAKVLVRKPSVSSGPGTPITPTASSKVEARSAKGDGVNVNITGDKTRDRCLEILYDALSADSGAPTDLILKRAKGIEVAVYNDFGGTTAQYKSKLRSLYVNLKDVNNPGLRESVVSGDVTAEKFARMTSQEMASEERKAADNKIQEENLHNSLGAEEQQAETDAFQCSKCKQRKCRYRQAQTRSADEPMTTFVTCVNCKNRWKFS